jgi:SET domain-containing protein
MGKDIVQRYPRVVVKKSSNGKGIFAQEEISRGSKILQYIGKKIPTVEADANPNRYIFEIDEKWSIDGSSFYNLARYFNHSCNPNAESVLEGEDRIFISAKRKISKNEEITFNYGEDYLKKYFKKSGCKCEKCREAFL